MRRRKLPEGWISHAGGACPVPGMTVVRLMYRGPERKGREGERISCAPAMRLDWSHDRGPDDIIGFQEVRW